MEVVKNIGVVSATERLFNLWQRENPAPDGCKYIHIRSDQGFRGRAFSGIKVIPPYEICRNSKSLGEYYDAIAFAHKYAEEKSIEVETVEI